MKNEKRKVRRKNINFRQTGSDRAATRAYRDFGRVLRGVFRSNRPD